MSKPARKAGTNCIRLRSARALDSSTFFRVDNYGRSIGQSDPGTWARTSDTCAGRAAGLAVGGGRRPAVIGYRTEAEG